jgi:4-alpha-glucanotransferase
MKQRSSGILMHLSSLPGPYGIGSMGREAFHFIDFLHKAGQHYWQILPLVPTGLGNSPYMSPSVFAGNPLLIDLELLVEDGLLTWQEVSTARAANPDQVDPQWVNRTHPALLKLAYQRADADTKNAAADFAQQEADWLPDYALFSAATQHFGGCSLAYWPDKALLHREPEAMKKYRTLLSEEIQYHIFCQYLFFKQWNAVHSYAKANDVQIIGDLPIYISDHSADLWAHPEYFQVDKDYKLTAVAGVPADAFSETGQRWGNPLYNWENHEKDGFAWWSRRIQKNLAFYDVMRFDHFRGFDTYWAIDPDCENALIGQWHKGPGMKLINALRKNVPEADFIAEDLGLLSPSAYQLVADSGLPGMRVLVDAFDPSGTSSFLPHACPQNAVMYTSTHDTPTFVQWLTVQSSKEERDFATRYLRLRDDEGLGWGAVCGAWGSPCQLAIASFQDVLGLGADARMNTPGTSGTHNWGWRVRREAINDEVAHRLRVITQTYGRLVPKQEPPKAEKEAPEED